MNFTCFIYFVFFAIHIITCCHLWCGWFWGYKLRWYGCMWFLYTTKIKISFLLFLGFDFDFDFDFWGWVCVWSGVKGFCFFTGVMLSQVYTSKRNLYVMVFFMCWSFLSENVRTTCFSSCAVLRQFVCPFLFISFLF